MNSQEASTVGGELGESIPLNLSNSGAESGSSPSILGRLSLLPKRMEDREGGAMSSSTAAMDLSTTKEDGDANEGGDDHPAAGISLVKPEVLFGKRGAEEDEDVDDNKADSLVAPSMPFSPFLASGLAAAMAAMASGGNPAGAAAVTPPSLGSNEMRNAFQEVLKLYGVPAEIAAAIAKNAQSAQGKSRPAIRWT